MSLLPQELWDRTIDCLAADRHSGPSKHYADLRTCALTCQSWLPRAQRQLYKHVELDRLESTRLFARTLEESPDLCPFVKRLEFWFKHADWKSQLTPVEDVPFPAHLIAGLTNLHTLRFTCGTSSSGACEVQINFMNKWRECRQLRSLWLEGFFFNAAVDLIKIIWSFPLLEELNIFKTAWPEGDTSVDPAEFPGHCQMLTNVDMREAHRVHDLLPLLGPAIQKLSVVLMWYVTEPDFYAAISNLLELRSMQIQIIDPHYDWLASVLSKVHSTRLEELLLDFSVISRDAIGPVLGIFANEALDELLSHKPLDGIRRLRIIMFKRNKTGKADVERLVREARALLPRFVERGTIECRFNKDVFVELKGLTGEAYED
ncbi:hypothetical protein L226DRAFT_617275 [Lentinus tigrinus ALCF2SS1-7]|uniref:F-box domain-containing protein n=1 Tax=Lentinus tigrinus ALCF2SS1-6 TaxID=1328759 RepID=A0A5C2RQG2_9APHY|nr:hypothetical protein L227DRAFT_657983 [Lentinus tigrinus ALCF2SS1-6]RPD68813.1 hypothetical protein L226DRAFT_617275 [Lentinus tigrinus ALCF2SS1-7]